MKIDHKRTYQSDAIRYDELIAREDYQGNLLQALGKIIDIESKTFLDLGSGTGRIAKLIAPVVKQVFAFDIALPMLQVASREYTRLAQNNVSPAVADHREIPLKNASVEIATSGWSLCYLVDWYRSTWRVELAKAFAEIKRVLKQEGKIVLIETLGTGYVKPHPPDHLLGYFRLLDKMGFQSFCIRTDYLFKDLSEAMELAGSFFGEEMREKIHINRWKVLPECTGIWWGSVRDLTI